MVTNEQFLDYIFYLQKKLGVEFKTLVGKIVMGAKVDTLDPIFVNIIQEALTEYAPQADVTTKVKVEVSATFPGSFNSDFFITSQDYVVSLGNLTFTFSSVTDFKNELIVIINKTFPATIDDNGDIIIELPSFINGYFTEFFSVDNSNALTLTTTLIEQGVIGHINDLSVDDIVNLINYSEKYLNTLCSS